MSADRSAATTELLAATARAGLANSKRGVQALAAIDELEKRAAYADYIRDREAGTHVF